MCDFHDWPLVWDRGEPKPEPAEEKVAVATRVAPNIDPSTLLSPYQNASTKPAAAER